MQTYLKSTAAFKTAPNSRWFPLSTSKLSTGTDRKLNYVADSNEHLKHFHGKLFRLPVSASVFAFFLFPPISAEIVMNNLAFNCSGSWSWPS